MNLGNNSNANFPEHQAKGQACKQISVKSADPDLLSYLLNEIELSQVNLGPQAAVYTIWSQQAVDSGLNVVIWVYECHAPSYTPIMIKRPAKNIPSLKFF